MLSGYEGTYLHSNGNPKSHGAKITGEQKLWSFQKKLVHRKNRAEVQKKSSLRKDRGAV